MQIHPDNRFLGVRFKLSSSNPYQYTALTKKLPVVLASHLSIQSSAGLVSRGGGHGHDGTARADYVRPPSARLDKSTTMMSALQGGNLNAQQSIILARFYNAEASGRCFSY